MLMKIKILFVFFLLLVGFTETYAQKERKMIRAGNELFNGQQFEKSEVEYRKALEEEDTSFEAAFNLGDALYKQEKFEDALQQFSGMAEKETDKERLGELYHNMGNTFLSMNKLDESIEAYKNSLRNRPASKETKYNLEFARRKKQEQEQEQNKEQDKDQDQNKDQNKDQDKDKDQNQDQNQNQDEKQQDQNKDQQNKDQQDQNQDQDKEDQGKKDQEEKDQGEKDGEKDGDKDPDKNENQEQNKEQQQPSGEQEGKISKENAERLLEALLNDEKEVQDKVQKEKAKLQEAKKVKIEKEW